MSGLKGDFCVRSTVWNRRHFFLTPKTNKFEAHVNSAFSALFGWFCSRFSTHTYAMCLFRLNHCVIVDGFKTDLVGAHTQIYIYRSPSSHFRSLIRFFFFLRLLALIKFVHPVNAIDILRTAGQYILRYVDNSFVDIMRSKFIWYSLSLSHNFT